MFQLRPKKCSQERKNSRMVLLNFQFGKVAVNINLVHRVSTQSTLTVLHAQKDSTQSCRKVVKNHFYNAWEHLKHVSIKIRANILTQHSQICWDKEKWWMDGGKVFWKKMLKSYAASLVIWWINLVENLVVYGNSICIELFLIENYVILRKTHPIASLINRIELSFP